MSAQILDAIDGIITVEVTGKLSPAELAENQAEILSVPPPMGRRCHPQHLR